MGLAQACWMMTVPRHKAMNPPGVLFADISMQGTGASWKGFVRCSGGTWFEAAV